MLKTEIELGWEFSCKCCRVGELVFIDGVAMCGGLLFVGTCRSFCEDGLVSALATDRLFFTIMMERNEKN